MDFSFDYPEGWSVTEACEIPYGPFQVCSNTGRYRSASPAEWGVSPGQAIFEVALASPESIAQILSAQPLNGVYVEVRRLPASLDADTYARAVDGRLRLGIQSIGASLLDFDTRVIGGVSARTYRYELTSWGPCIYLGASGCLLATGRVWNQALLVQGDLEYIISCEGSSQRSRSADGGPPTLVPFSVLAEDCEQVFESFTLTNVASLTPIPTPVERPNLAKNASFEGGSVQPDDWQYQDFSVKPGPFETAKAHTGVRSVRLDGPISLATSGCTVRAFGEWRAAVPIPLDTAKSYSYAAWTMGETAGARSSLGGLGVYYLDAAGNQLDNTGGMSAQPSNTWVRTWALLSPPYPEGTTHVRLYLHLVWRTQREGAEICPVGETLSVWFDDVEFREAP